MMSHAMQQWHALLDSLPRIIAEESENASAAVVGAQQNGGRQSSQDEPHQQVVQSAPRGRSTSSAHVSTFQGNIEDWREDDEEEEEKELKEKKRLAEQREQLEERALATVRPFLEALFERGPLATASDTAANDSLTPEPVSRQLIPGQTFHEVLRREMAKPQVLSYCPTTDRAPLTTRTAPPTFTSFPAPQGVAEQPFAFFGTSAAATARYHRAVDDVEGFPPGTRFDASPQATLQKIKEAQERLRDQPPLYKGSFYDERSELQAAHVDDLLATIHQARATPLRRQPWVRR